MLARAIRKALKEAGIRPADVDHVNAHAAGIPTLDAFEARAIAEVFGDKTPVFAPKGHLGNSGGAQRPDRVVGEPARPAHGDRPGTLNFDTDAISASTCSRRRATVTKPYAVKVATPTWASVRRCDQEMGSRRLQPPGSPQARACGY